MKKKYTTPSIFGMSLISERPISGSNDITSKGSVTDITFGGKVDGSVTPEVKGNTGYDVWDDDWSQ